MPNRFFEQASGHMWHRVVAAVTLAVVFAAHGARGFAVHAAQTPSAETRASVDSRLNRLEAEVTAAEDLAAIKRLQRIYGYYVDKGMWEDLGSFFTEDAVANYPAGTFVGHDSIRQHLFMNVGGRKMGEVGLGDNRLYNHMNIQPVVHLDPGGKTAKGRWRAFATFGSLGGGATWAEGVYEMQYAKVNGVWKFSRLDYYSGFGAPYATGWGTPAGPGAPRAGGPQTGASAPPVRPRRVLAHPADRERNMACDGFPAACIAPFHYENPGTLAGGTAWDASTMLASVRGGGDVRRRAADLAHRATLLRDETEVENLQRVYGYYLDRAMWDQVADLFADQGTIEVAQQGVYVGKQRVREFLGTLGRHGLVDGWLNDHIQLQPVVDIAADGKTARVRSREFAMTGKFGGQGFWSEGIYENKYVKQNGVWKIQSLHFYPTFITDYDKGWGKDAQPAPGLNALLPPDRPPTEVYNIYPKQHIPPYHYRNPVTGEPPHYPTIGGPDAKLAAEKLEPKAKPFNAGRATDVEATLAQAERTVARVKDFHELDNLESAYGYYLDKNLWNNLADLFSQDGSMELAQRGVYKGREHVRTFLQQVFGRGHEGPVEGQLGNHLQMQPVIHVAEDGKSAKIRVRMMQQLSFGSGAAMGASVYENEAVKEDGVWKFSTVHTMNTFTASYDAGWTKTTSTGVPGPSKDPTPDAPPTLVFRIFPVVYDIPFHYSNPVSGRTALPPLEHIAALQNLEGGMIGRTAKASSDAAGQATAVAGAGAPANVTAERLLNAASEPSQWMTYGGNYEEQRYSRLSQINQNNVKQLGLAWFADYDTHLQQTATPLFIDGVIYVSTAWSKVYAFDARSGRQLWQYNPKVPGEWAAKVCCGLKNRGVAAWNGKIYVGTLDGRLVAIDAKTGSEVWSTLTIDKSQRYSITSAPRVVKGKVLIGNSGGEYGVRGYLGAYDAETGKPAWRFYTVPGNPNDGFENEAMKKAAATWSGEWWKLGGGGTVWDAIVYDPGTDLVYFGTGNGTPWNQRKRDPSGGDNLYLASIIALKADTGEYVWHYQTTPADTWDYDAVSPMTIANLTLDGKERHVVMQPCKNGFFYVLDAASGELLRADAFTQVNWADGVDLKTGRPRVRMEAHYKVGKVFNGLPGAQGAHAWHSNAYSPETGLLYIPTQHGYFPWVEDPNYAPSDVGYNLGIDFDARFTYYRDHTDVPSDFVGFLQAWDPATGKQVWRGEPNQGATGGALATAGGLVFQGGGSSQEFRAYDARTGEKVWNMQALTGVFAGAISYSLDGQQFIAISAGGDQTGGYYAPNYSRLLVFALNGKAQLPPRQEYTPPPLTPPPATAAPEIVQAGQHKYSQYCTACHGENGQTRSGNFPDLTRTPLLHTQEGFDQVVLKGVLAEKGMASFAAVLKPEGTRAIRAFIIARANELKNMPPPSEPPRPRQAHEESSR